MKLTVDRTPKMDGFEYRFVVPDSDMVRIGPEAVERVLLLSAATAQEVTSCLRGLLVIAEDLQRLIKSEVPTTHLNLSIRESYHDPDKT